MTVETLTPEELAARLGLSREVQNEAAPALREAAADPAAFLRKTWGLADPEQAKHFTASEARCLLTMFPVAECEHCQRLAERPPGPAVVVTEVDRESGVVTFEARKP